MSLIEPFSEDVKIGPDGLSLVELWHDTWRQATRSRDNYRQNGAVLVTDSGYPYYGFDRIPAGVPDTEERTHVSRRRYNKDDRLIHYLVAAAEDAIFQAARRGRETEGATLLTLHHPLPPAARSIAQCGIRAVYLHRWFQENRKYAPRYEIYAQDILECTGVHVVWCDHLIKFDEPKDLIFDGRFFGSTETTEVVRWTIGGDQKILTDFQEERRKRLEEMAAAAENTKVKFDDKGRLIYNRRGPKK